MGKYYVRDGFAALVTPKGERVMVPADQVKSLVREGGWSTDTSEATRKRLRVRTLNSADVLKDGQTAGAMGLLSGLTMGASDLAIGAATGPEGRKAMGQLRAHNAGDMLATEIAGMALSSAVGGPMAGLTKGAQMLGRGATAAMGGGRAARVAGKLAAGAAEGAALGTGAGMTQLSQLEELTPGVAIGTLASSTAKGAAGGAALGAAGMGVRALGRFGKRKVSGLVKRGEQQAEQRSLMAEREALQAKGAAVETGEGGVVRLMGDKKDATRLMAVEKRLTSLDAALTPAQGGLSGVLGTLAEGRAQQLLGGGLGAVVGGLPGMAIGALASPVAMRGLKAVLTPLGRGAVKAAGAAVRAGSAVARSELGIAAGAVAKHGAVGTRGAATRALSSAEWGTLADDLEASSPAAVELQMMAQLDTAGVHPDMQAPMIAEEVKRMGFLREKMEELAPGTLPKEIALAPSPLDQPDLRGEMGPAPEPIEIPTSKRAAADPGPEARIRMTRFAQAAMDPESVLRGFGRRELTPEAVETAQRLYPDDLATYRRAVMADVRAHVARAGVYSMDQEQQISLFLGQPSRSLAALASASGPPPDPTGQPAGGGGGPKGLDRAQQTKLERMMDGD